ncbi:ankyrin repeat protein [Moniliophthora roreri MCA 2997]|uniref:Ankyrin repeat protein n=1 Tax=Moniliophthora roreri (strain MCA 2997) TaxID=1381753 RepID=V2YW05_MONRO|nr:ankyrin repeat protein [Moniliophthora roreri MCA 2997]
MSQNSEAQAFIQRVQSLPKEPGVSLDAVLQPSLDDEAELRKRFATDKDNARLKDKYVGLVDVFDAPADIRTIRARVVKDEKDLSAKYVMPLPEANRKKDGEPCMVVDLEEFKKNWSVFTEGSLSQLLDWNNVVAAGGSVLACLMPLPESAKASKRAMRKFYHSAAYPTSDVDLFLWGMTPEEAEVKITKIYEAVRDSVPWDVTCVRTKHTVSIHSQYPYRSVQIVLRLYKSPAEILAGFDIDSACCAYDGNRVWANPRAVVSMMRQCNTVDMTRRSPSYEVRLAKYSSRAFEVYVPTLSREDVDPTIYERSIVRVEGLARLLVFEKLKDADSRYQFLEARRTLRGRPNALSHHYRRKKHYKGDLKGDMSIGGLEMNDYDVVSLHIPYGPGWDARRIEKLVYSTDLGMNSPFNPKNKDRRLHRHPAFFGTGPECLDDCCEYCPDPIDEDEKKLQKEEDEQYVRGRISFIEEDPGRQSISGSFNPIDVGEWSEHVYVGPTEKFFAAIVTGDQGAITKMIEEGIDVTKRDHVGRMPLHVAIMAKHPETACYLIDHGARVTSRLADGRTALHLAAKLDMVDVVKRLLERSKINEELLKKEGSDDGDGDVKMKDAAPERPSSEDDWSSDDNGVVSMDEDDADGDDEDEGGSNENDDEEGGGRKKRVEEPPQTPAESGALPEDENDEPDVFDVNAPDWDLAFTPLAYAILFASMPVMEALISAGADVTLATQAKYGGAPALHPLTLTMHREDEDEASKIIERLVPAGAVSSTADDNLRTIFLKMIDANKTKLVMTLLRVDPKASAVVNFPAVQSQYWNGQARFPLVAAIQNAGYPILAALLAYGAKVVFEEKDVSDALSLQKTRNNWYGQPTNNLDMAVTALEAAIACFDDVVQLLIPLGASADVTIKAAKVRYANSDDKKSLLDWVQYAIDSTDEELEKLEEGKSDKKKNADKVDESGMKGYYAKYLDIVEHRHQYNRANDDEEKERVDDQRRKWTRIKTYLSHVERLLISKGAKTWKELNLNEEQNSERDGYTRRIRHVKVEEPATKPETRYRYLREQRYGVGNLVPSHLTASYDELFEACMKGDNGTIQRLCLPAEGTETDQAPLQITVQLSHPTNEYSDTGLTPLAIAVLHRHWNTARLVFTISAAQYDPEEKDKKFSINLEGFHEDEDSDDDMGSENSYDSDETIDKAPINFVDVANRPSKVSCQIPPSRMLHELTVYWEDKKGTVDYKIRSASNLLQSAIVQKDLDAFLHILGMYKLSEPPVELKGGELDTILGSILGYDHPKILDEFIRKTGHGVTVRSLEKSDGEDEEEVHAVNDKNRVYLGLNVHGKKRKDLAKKNDPNAGDNYEGDGKPLLWRAIETGALEIVDYLSGNGPYEAYEYYGMCNSNEHAIALRRTKNLEDVLPQWLGWTINALGESPLTAAVISRKLSMVKQLFGKNPRLMSLALKERIKFIGYNILMIAAHQGCTTQMFDYLLANGQSPVETDTVRGWNLYHILASGDANLFEHLLKKLPRDVSESLLVQQSKGRLNTPLHIAVSCGRKDIVELIINFSKSGLLLRNVIGSLPLHTAVLNGYANITKLLLDVSPKEALHTENGVGDTPLEMATLQELLVRVQERSPSCPELGRNSWSRNDDLRRYDVEKLEGVIPELKKAIGILQEDGKLTQGSQLNEELLAFARYLETQLVTAKVEDAEKRKREEAKKKRREAKEEEEPKAREKKEDVYEASRSGDYTDREKTFKFVLEAVTAKPGDRCLVHLVDVQRSVSGDLTKVQREPTKGEVYDDDGLEPEVDAETKLRQKSMLFGCIHVGPDQH